jgi:hypothetical protein
VDLASPPCLVDLSSEMTVPQHPEGHRALPDLIRSTGSARAAEQALEEARSSPAWDSKSSWLAWMAPVG